MAGSNGSLTLKGLAQILRDHMDGTAARFTDVGVQIDALRGEIGAVTGLVRDLGQIVLRNTEQIGIVGGLVQHLSEFALRQVEQLEEHRREIRQVFSRMEQQDAKIGEQNARIEAMNQEIRDLRVDIRRILDTMERRDGDGGGRDQ